MEHELSIYSINSKGGLAFKDDQTFTFSGIKEDSVGLDGKPMLVFTIVFY